MLHASTRKLIDRLSEMTELGKLDWTESEDGNIYYATEGYSVSLTESPNEVIITSKDGKELERASAEELATTQQDDGKAYTLIVAEMTNEASRVARGTEAAISSLLADLQDAPAPDSVDVATAETDADEDLQEDPVNETTAIMAEPDNSDATDVETDLPDETIDQVDASAPDEVSAEDETTDEETSPEIIVAPVMEAPDVDLSARDDADDSHATHAATSDESETGADAEYATDEGSQTDSETESDVTEAVARLADEVNQREESSLDAAAVSAVGAVALAAGLTTQASSEQAETSSTAEETDIAPSTEATAETSETPAYVPFGLERETEAESEVLAMAEIAPEEIAEPVEIETPLEAPETDTTFSLDVETEPSSVETTWNSTEAEAETPAEADATPVQEPVTEAEIPVAPTLSAVPDFGRTESTEIAEPAEETPTEIAAETNSEDSIDQTVATEAPEVEAEPEIAEAQPPKTYSLSGIGAGFGLGALSAKTEASGIPAPSSPGGAAPEKVIIDATDDVLPELEGNLNVSLAETASAAVSAANAKAATSEQTETPADAETDILKPRTRFNPWD